MRRSSRLLGRRAFLIGSGSLGALPLLKRHAFADAPPGMKFGPVAPFNFETLKARAQATASEPYRAPPLRAADLLQKLDYDAIGKVRFRPEMTLWSDRQFGPGIRFFHLHRWSKAPVRINLVQNGTAREILYSPDYFEKPAGSPAQALPRDIGFGGFRVLSDDAKGDWLAYQGASYFRSAGPLDQYGLSARGIAIDTAAGRVSALLGVLARAR